MIGGTWCGGAGLAALLLTLIGSSAAASAQARAPRSAVWLEHHAADDAVRHAREEALRLELHARDITLIGAVTAPPAEGQADAPLAQSAVAVLARSGPVAVLWLEADAKRPVSWLYVRRHDREALGKAPLPHPPEAIDTQLFALAAASLLEQILSEPNATPLAPTPAQVAAAAPPAAPPPPARPRPVIEPLPKPPLYFVQLGLVAPFALPETGMEAASKPDLDSVYLENNARGEEAMYVFDETSIYVPDADSYDAIGSIGSECGADGIRTEPGQMPSKFCVRVAQPGFVFVPAMRLALGAWLLDDFALVLAYQWHFTIEPETFFGAQALMLDGQLLVLGDRSSAVSIALLGELGAGRTETPVVGYQSDGFTVREITANGLSGPLEATAGFALRCALAQKLGMIASLRMGGRFPATQLVTSFSAALEYAL